MSEPSGFVFLDQTATFRDPEARIARIPAGTRGKRELLTLLARQLEFPAYFGFNWDALSDCLRDLSWLRDVRRVVILHDALPLAAAEQRRTYLEVLRDAVAGWHPGEEHELLAIFPTQARRAIAGMLSP